NTVSVKPPHASLTIKQSSGGAELTVTPPATSPSSTTKTQPLPAPLVPAPSAAPSGEKKSAHAVHYHHNQAHSRKHKLAGHFTAKHEVTLNVSSRVGYGINKMGQLSLQKAVAMAGNKTGVPA